MPFSLISDPIKDALQDFIDDDSFKAHGDIYDYML